MDEEYKQKIEEIIGKLQNKQKNTFGKLMKDIGKMNNSSVMVPQMSVFETYFKNIVAQMEGQINNIYGEMLKELTKKDAKISDDAINKVKQLSTDQNMPEEIRMIFAQLETIMQERKDKEE